MGSWWQWPAVPGRLSAPPHGALSLTAATRRLRLCFWFRRTCCSLGGRVVGEADPTNEGRVFSVLLLSSPFLPAPDCGAFVFQVGSYFHLQVSDKRAQTSPTPPGPSQTREGAGRTIWTAPRAVHPALGTCPAWVHTCMGP